jgi:peptide/nickel transport system substrate-binding protein
LTVLALILVAACAPQSSPEAQATADASSRARQSRVIVMAMRYEPTDLAPKIISQGATEGVKRPFNAYLALMDGSGNPRPYLAEALPELNTESWRLFPDGRMETTHRLRAGLTWHDGQPLTAADFVFAWRVYSAPGARVFTPEPQEHIAEVAAPDSRSVLIRWRSPYADASALSEHGFEPLPRHILGQGLAALEQEPTGIAAFLNQAFWASEYVNAGPYVLKRWEPGSHLEGVAFDGHALGRPRIDRIIMRAIGDENTVLTNVLAGDVDVAIRLTLRFEHGVLLKREWVAANRGTVLFALSTGGQYALVQFRPEYLRTPELLDVRVRQALVSSIDSQALNETLFEGEVPIIHTFLSPQAPDYQRVDRVITKYPYDPRHAEQLMIAAGLSKDREGFFAKSAVQFRPEFRFTAGRLNEQAQAIMVDSWRRAGFNVQPSVLPTAQELAEARHTFAGIANAGGVLAALRDFPSSQIASPANRRVGRNRGGWSNPQYDRLWDAYNTTLARNERTELIAQMTRLLSEEVPAFPLWAAVDVWVHASHVRGLEPGTPDTLQMWNIHEWEVI